MEDTNYLEWGMDVEEWKHDGFVLSPPHLLVEEVSDHKGGFPVTYISFPCHPLEDGCDGGDDNDGDQRTKHSHPKPEEKLVKRKPELEFHNIDGESHYKAVDDCKDEEIHALVKIAVDMILDL